MSRYLGDHEGVDYEDDLEYCCERCAGCQEIIRPEQTAVLISPYIKQLRRTVDIFYHRECLEDLEEYTGEDLIE